MVYALPCHYGHSSRHWSMELGNGRQLRHRHQLTPASSPTQPSSPDGRLHGRPSRRPPARLHLLWWVVLVVGGIGLSWWSVRVAMSFRARAALSARRGETGGYMVTEDPCLGSFIFGAFVWEAESAPPMCSFHTPHSLASSLSALRNAWYNTPDHTLPLPPWAISPLSANVPPRTPPPPPPLPSSETDREDGAAVKEEGEEEMEEEEMEDGVPVATTPVEVVERSPRVPTTLVVAVVDGPLGPVERVHWVYEVLHLVYMLSTDSVYVTLQIGVDWEGKEGRQEAKAVAMLTHILQNDRIPHNVVLEPVVPSSSEGGGWDALFGSRVFDPVHPDALANDPGFSTRDACPIDIDTVLVLPGDRLFCAADAIRLLAWVDASSSPPAVLQRPVHVCSEDATWSSPTCHGDMMAFSWNVLSSFLSSTRYHPSTPSPPSFAAWQSFIPALSVVISPSPTSSASTSLSHLRSTRPIQTLGHPIDHGVQQRPN